MRLLLDENFPLVLERRLRAEGHAAEHLITLGQRGTPDSDLIRRLEREPDLVLLTQDSEFLGASSHLSGKVIVSHVSQARPLDERLEIWMEALGAFLQDPPPQSLFELTDQGDLVPWKLAEG